MMSQCTRGRRSLAGWIFLPFLIAACGGAHGGHGGAGADGGVATPDGGPPAIRVPAVAGASAVLEDVNPDPNVVEVSLTAQMTTVELAGSPIEMMTYNGVSPGPLLQAKDYRPNRRRARSRHHRQLPHRNVPGRNRPSHPHPLRRNPSPTPQAPRLWLL